MINRAQKEQEMSENDDKSKNYDNLIKNSDEKNLYSFKKDINFSTKIVSPNNNKIYTKEREELTSLKKDFYSNNWSYTPYSGNKFPDLSQQKYFFDSSGIKDLNKSFNFNVQKDIKQNLDNKFENLLLSRKKGKEKEDIKFNDMNSTEKIKKTKNISINLAISDSFFNLIENIYKYQELQSEFLQGCHKNNEKKYCNTYENNKTNNILFDITNNQINENTIYNDEISCICYKRKCLNNYCSCHKNGRMCNKNCRCTDCENNIQSFGLMEGKKQNQKICKCKKSNCLLSYCECKKEGIKCSKFCLCMDCKNNKEITLNKE